MGWLRRRLALRDAACGRSSRTRADRKRSRGETNQPSQPGRHADRRTGAAPFDLDRKTDEFEAALPTSLSRLTSPSMCVKPISRQNVMHLEIVAPGAPRASPPRRRTCRCPCGPATSPTFFVRPGKVGDEGRRALGAAVEVHVQQHRVLGLISTPAAMMAFSRSSIEMSDFSESFCERSRQHRFGEVLQRHLVDRLGLEIGVEVRWARPRGCRRDRPAPAPWWPMRAW